MCTHAPLLEQLDVLVLRHLSSDSLSASLLPLKKNKTTRRKAFNRFVRSFLSPLLLVCVLTCCALAFLLMTPRHFRAQHALPSTENLRTRGMSFMLSFVRVLACAVLARVGLHERSERKGESARRKNARSKAKEGKREEKSEREQRRNVHRCAMAHGHENQRRRHKKIFRGVGASFWVSFLWL